MYGDSIYKVGSTKYFLLFIYPLGNEYPLWIVILAKYYAYSMRYLIVKVDVVSF